MELRARDLASPLGGALRLFGALLLAAAPAAAQDADLEPTPAELEAARVDVAPTVVDVAPTVVDVAPTVADVAPTMAEAEPPPSERAGAEATAEAVAADEAAEAGVDLETYWARRLARAQQRIDLARERAEKTDAAYSRARHDRNPRGEALVEVKERRTAAERELREAEASLPRLVEQARRAGVPPGILREYWDEDE